MIQASKSQLYYVEFFSNLIDSDEEAIYVVSWRIRVKCFFVLLDFHLNKISQFFNLSKNSVMVARKMLHDPGKDVVHLWERSAQYPVYV